MNARLLTMRMSMFWAVCAALTACSGDTGWTGQFPASPSAATFQTTAYPVLMRDCAFSECHGAPQRYLQVFGPGRTRLDPATMPSDPPTPGEVQVSYQRALSMLALEGAVSLDDSRLLRKPLAISAGGVGHLGTDEFGRNVYANKSSPGYVTLQQWASGVMGAPSAPTAMPTPPVAGSAP